jgi:cytochrome c peroxidase
MISKTKSRLFWLTVPAACTLLVLSVASCGPAQTQGASPAGAAPPAVALTTPAESAQLPANVFPNRRELLAFLPAAIVGNVLTGQQEFMNAASVEFPRTAKTNGRSCATCHIPGAGFTISPAAVQTLHAQHPDSPLFTAITADAGPDVTPAEQLAQLTNHALIRVNIGNPYYDAHYHDPMDPMGMYNPQVIRLWRSVPTSVNSGLDNTMAFNDPVTHAASKGTVMWDLREPSLEHQAFDATHGHAQETGPLPGNFGANVAAFESMKCAVPAELGKPGLKLLHPKLDPNHSDPSDPFFGTPVFNPATFKKDFLKTANIRPGSLEEQGMMLFAGTPSHPHCIVCHNQPETLAGGTKIMRSAGVSEANDLNFPMVHMRLKDAHGMWHQVTTSDPGVAVTTGRYEDLNTFKVPQLRGLSNFGRYFHNNKVTNLDDVMEHYKEALPEIFHDLRGRDRQAIAAFLNAI